jgi:hypothetical protein
MRNPNAVISSKWLYLSSIVFFLQRQYLRSAHNNWHCLLKSHDNRRRALLPDVQHVAAISLDMALLWRIQDV